MGYGGAGLDREENTTLLSNVNNADSKLAPIAARLSMIVCGSVLLNASDFRKREREIHHIPGDGFIERMAISGFLLQITLTRTAVVMF